MRSIHGQVTNQFTFFFNNIIFYQDEDLVNATPTSSPSTTPTPLSGSSSPRTLDPTSTLEEPVPNTCEICGKTLANRKNLIKHVKSIHGQVKQN